MAVLSDIFERAVEELQIAGLRLLIGSMPPLHEHLHSGPQISLVPARFANAATAPLALRISATAENGPCRFIVNLGISGEDACCAVERLIENHPEIWSANYLGIGLWISWNRQIVHLNDLEQLRADRGVARNITGVLLHCSTGRAVQAGLMWMSVIYRSVLDELSDSSRMPRLSTLVLEQLDHQRPRFDKTFRP